MTAALPGTYASHAGPRSRPSSGAVQRCKTTRAKSQQRVGGRPRGKRATRRVEVDWTEPRKPSPPRAPAFDRPSRSASTLTLPLFLSLLRGTGRPVVARSATAEGRAPTSRFAATRGSASRGGGEKESRKSASKRSLREGRIRGAGAAPCAPLRGRLGVAHELGSSREWKKCKEGGRDDDARGGYERRGARCGSRDGASKRAQRGGPPRTPRRPASNATEASRENRRYRGERTRS